MNIDEAARATRKYKTTTVYGWGNPPSPAVCLGDAASGEVVREVKIFPSGSASRIACDRMNLLAVLEAIREPSENVARACRETADVESSYYEHNPYDRWRAMIDALIAEVEK